MEEIWEYISDVEEAALIAAEMEEADDDTAAYLASIFKGIDRADDD